MRALTGHRSPAPHTRPRLLVLLLLGVLLARSGLVFAVQLPPSASRSSSRASRSRRNTARWATRGSPVAFEIDDIQPAAGVGWSVLVGGRAERVTGSFGVESLWSKEEMVPWATGTRHLVIRIRERTIS